MSRTTDNTGQTWRGFFRAATEFPPKKRGFFQTGLPEVRRDSVPTVVCRRWSVKYGSDQTTASSCLALSFGRAAQVGLASAAAANNAQKLDLSSPVECTKRHLWSAQPSELVRAAVCGDAFV